MRVVIDTNVLLSAVLGGTLKAILGHWQNERFILVVTDEIVREYLDVFQRPKFGLPRLWLFEQSWEKKEETKRVRECPFWIKFERKRRWNWIKRSGRILF